MKEFKVIKPSLGFSNHQRKLEDLLNEYGRDGWNLNSVVPHAHGISFVIFERDKNRH